MKIGIAFAAAVATVSVPAQAEEEVLPPGFVAEHWVTLDNPEGGITIAHRFSGAICPQKMADLTIGGFTSHQEDGSDVSCAYGSEDGSQKLTVYFYKYPDLSGPQAFSSAIAAIKQIGQTTSLTVTSQADETRRCQAALARGLSNTLPAPEDAPNYPFGFAVFDVDGPEAGADSPIDDVTALAVFEHDGWIAKVRYTGNANAGGNGYYQACANVAFAAIQTAEALKQNAGLRQK